MARGLNGIGRGLRRGRSNDSRVPLLSVHVGFRFGPRNLFTWARSNGDGPKVSPDFGIGLLGGAVIAVMFGGSIALDGVLGFVTPLLMLVIYKVMLGE